MEEKVDVVVIGAGISGLCAAKLLNENGQSVVVLEAQERVGGRTHTVRDAEYNYTDVGGAYVGPTQRRVARLAKELELEFYMIDKKSKTRLYYEGKYGSYTGIVPEVTNPIKAMDLNNMQYLIDAIANDIPTEAPWRAKDAEELDSMTFQEFLNKHCCTNFAKEMGRLICQALFCAEPRELSALFVCYYVKSGGGVTRITTVTNGAQERKFVGGAMQLSERMADGLGDKVRLEQPVIRVEQSGKGAKVTTAHGKTYTCDYVISAMPLALLNRVTFDPPLPALKLQLIQRAPMGSIIKTMMFYKEAFWKAKGFCGEMITDSGPVLYCVDDTKPDGTFPCIMGFILSNHARELTELSEDERKNAVAEHYAKVFKMDEFLRPTNYVEKNWGAEQYSGGCYVSCMGPGVLTQFGKVVKQPFGKVYFAGTETASEWAGYMDGAVQAGERAAREVLHAKGNITKSEIEQAEPPSDYFPEPPVQHMFIEKILPSVPSFLMFCGGMLTAGLAWGVNKYCDIQMNFRK